MSNDIYVFFMSNDIYVIRHEEHRGNISSRCFEANASEHLENREEILMVVLCRSWINDCIDIDMTITRFQMVNINASS